MAKLDAYLHFDGNCSEAMTFYKGALGGELNLMMVGDSPMGKQAPPSDQKKVMHAKLSIGDMGLMGSDNMGDTPVKMGANISLSLSCASKKELDGIYSRLSAGGKATHQPKDEFFGYFGDLTDKYGITWMLVFEAPRS
jgi:PhnB protein